MFLRAVSDRRWAGDAAPRAGASSPRSTFVTAVAGAGAATPTLVRIARGPLRGLLWAWLRLTLRISVQGAHTPGPAVIVSNHPHVLDGLLVLMADTAMRPIARWHRVSLLRFGMWIGNCVITTTGTPVTPARGAFADALAHLRRGGRIWIAPEGGCQPLLTLRRPRSGAVRLAHAAKVPIQVLAVIHERHPGPTLRHWRPWRRPRVILRWGGTITMTGDLKTDTDLLMTAIADGAGATWSPPP